MRRRKLIMSTLLAAILAVNAVLLGWSVANDEAEEIAPYAIHIVFSLYLLAVALRSVNQNTISVHSESVLHLTTLTLLAFVFLGTIAILPSTPPTATLSETSPALWYLWHARLGLYMILFSMTSTTRQAPAFHYPPERIYTEKTVLAATNTDEENVTGVIGISSPVIFLNPAYVPTKAPLRGELFSFHTPQK